VDIIGTAKSEDYKKAFDKLKNSNTDSVIAILTPQSMSEPEKTAKEIVSFSKFKSIIALFLGRDSVKEAKKILKENNILCLDDL